MRRHNRDNTRTRKTKPPTQGADFCRNGFPLSSITHHTQHITHSVFAPRAFLFPRVLVALFSYHLVREDERFCE
jgi:hypothetical protein